ncbi:MAG: membrane protein insertion efficiency factor YidD [Bacteroidales bacterium]|nr:membrane protein insertion efficiency factor YidD [Bacteroidales bacterium]
MFLKAIFGTLILSILISSHLFGQKFIVEKHYHQFDVSEHRENFLNYANNENEIRQVVSSLFLFYKHFISSQDINACVFHPSCSVYAIESVKKYGMLKGALNAFDRMTRCHGMAAEYYPVDPETKKLYDPVP